MRAAVIIEHGGVENIAIHDDFPMPEASSGQVVIRVVATALNYHDIFSRRGMPGINIPMPLITGSDIAGEIVGLGQDVTDWAVGDRILIDPIIQQPGQFGMIGETTNGGKAEYTLTYENQLIRLPDTIDFDDAAALPIAYGTAYRMLHTIGGISEEDTVLILGASGGVGVACVQLAKLAGATIIACAGSDEKVQQLSDIGAHHTINYHKKDFMKAVWEIVGKPKILGKGGVDIAVNFTAGDTWTPTIRCICKGGKLLTCGATAGHDAVTDLRYVWTFEQQILGSNGWQREDLLSLIELVASGALKPIIGQVFSLEETAEAERLMEDRKIFGKVLIKP